MKLKKLFSFAFAAALIFVTNFAQSQINLEAGFYLMDVDGNGYADKEEVVRTIKMTNTENIEETYQEMMSEMDTNADGKIQKSEYVAQLELQLPELENFNPEDMLDQMNSPEFKEQLQSAMDQMDELTGGKGLLDATGGGGIFAMYDMNSNGFIEKSEINKLFELASNQMGGQELGNMEEAGDQFIAELDADSDQKVSIAEWNAVMADLDIDIDAAMQAFQDMQTTTEAN